MTRGKWMSLGSVMGNSVRTRRFFYNHPVIDNVLDAAVPHRLHMSKSASKNRGANDRAKQVFSCKVRQ